MKKIEKAVEYTSCMPQYIGWREINNKVADKIKNGIKNDKEAFDIIEDIRNDITKN